MPVALEDGPRSRTSISPPSAIRFGCSSQLVDDLFELARIDAAALTLELQRLPVAPEAGSTPGRASACSSALGALSARDPFAAARHSRATAPTAFTWRRCWHDGASSRRVEVDHVGKSTTEWTGEDVFQTLLKA
jgi:hypothetical protein